MKTIFLVEDSKITAELLKYQLEHEFDCKVTCFSNGNDLLANLMLNPDLIILDYFVQSDFNENGLDMLKKVKIIKSTIPVIMFSGQHDLKLTVELIRKGAVDYIDKNEDGFLDDICESVKRVFRFNDTQKAINKIKTNFSMDRTRLIAFGILGIFLIFTLLMI